MPLSSSSSSLLEYTTTNIPAFLTKLWTLVEDEKNSELIAWDQSGFSFHVYDQTRFAREILPRYFKHNNMASFIRQLNMYGFRKVNSIDHGSLRNEKEDLEFHHPYFIKDKEQFLEYIKRKVSDIKQHQQVQPQNASPAIGHNQQALLQQSNLQQLQSSQQQQQQQQNQLTCNPGSQSLQSIQAYPQIKLDEINKVLDEVSVIKSKQKMVDETLYSIKKENDALWKEVASLRQKHHHQQQIVNKLIHFLVHLANPVYMSNLKRAKPLMIDNQASLRNNAGSAGNVGVGSSSHLVELDEDNAIFNEEDLDSVNEVLSPSSYMNNNMEVIDKNDLYQAYLADDAAEVETINNAKNSVPAPGAANGDSGTLRAMSDHLPTKIRLGNLSMSSKPVVKRLKTADLNLAVGNKNLFRSPNYQIVNPKAIALNNYNSNASTNLNTIMNSNMNAASSTGTVSEALDSGGLFIGDAGSASGLGDAAISLIGSPLANNATNVSTTTTTNSPIISMPASPNLISSNLNRNNIMMISEANNSTNNESSGESVSSKGASQPVQLAVLEKTQNDTAPAENNQSLKRTLSSTEMNDQIESLQIDLNSIKDFLTSNVYNQQDTYSTINQLFSNNSISLDQIEQSQSYMDAPTDISLQDQMADNIISSPYDSQNGSSKVIGNELIQYDPMILPSTGDLFLNEELFASDDKPSKQSKSLIASKTLPNVAASDGLHTPSIYVDANPADAGKFKWNLN